VAWKCPGCGGQHDDLPLSYATVAPATWNSLADDVRERSALFDEACVVRHAGGKTDHFIRANIELPLNDVAGGRFLWTVWCSLSAANFQATVDAWDVSGREASAPMFAWLATELPVYPSTLNLRARIHTRPVGQRPVVELEPAEHPLAVEQRRGITMSRVQEIAAAVLHPG
jgi:hypothetical protein